MKPRNVDWLKTQRARVRADVTSAPEAPDIFAEEDRIEQALHRGQSEYLTRKRNGTLAVFSALAGRDASVAVEIGRSLTRKREACAAFLAVLDAENAAMADLAREHDAEVTMGLLVLDRRLDDAEPF